MIWQIMAQNGLPVRSTVRTFEVICSKKSPTLTPKSLCEQSGMKAIIIDSLSHEWEGEGGILDIQS
jgi:hypothetical protein